MRHFAGEWFSGERIFILGLTLDVHGGMLQISFR